MASVEKLLQYVPLESCVDPTFWHKFAKLKLDVDMLVERDREIWGQYSPFYHRILNVDCTSFNRDFNQTSKFSKAHGHHLNLNTLEGFKKLNKVDLLHKYGGKLNASLCSGEAVDNPSLLSTFLFLTYADLKKFHFYYWFAFPAAANLVCTTVKPAESLSNHWTEAQIGLLFEAHEKLNIDQQGFFGVVVKDNDILIDSLKNIFELLQGSTELTNVYWAFVDPCEDPEHPGWPLRNFLFLVYKNCTNLREEQHSVICLRKKSNSILLNIKFSGENVADGEKWVGWEANARGKLGPRFVDLSSNMDPIKLAEESVDLNLRLMKWRLAPDLDLAVVKSTRCLLLGAGTLGCSVARSLLAWGVEHVTFVDNGTVSYSNPVRQSLYNFEDCQNETCKAVAAAAALKKIFPSVKSEGIKMTIPMPGRGLNDVDSASQLEQLVSQHDVLFLLTDTRESRWLPTLLAAKHLKVAITAALGFDTYLVMRHGLPGSPTRLGCYFCNDVTAPGNSAQDRTLDQQCTVTRPGVSQVAAALAVEIMVSLLQHPDKAGMSTDVSTSLGQVPHSIRGFLSTFTQITPSTPAFSQCTACSDKVVGEYESRGVEFLKEVLLRASYLEDLTGLTELHQATQLIDVMEFGDDEEM